MFTIYNYTLSATLFGHFFVPYLVLGIALAELSLQDGSDD